MFCAFPVARLGHVVDVAERLRPLGAQDLVDLGQRPDVVLPLLALAVGVLGRVEAALRAGHPAQDVIERLPGDAGEARSPSPGRPRDRPRPAGRCRRASSRSEAPASARRSSSGRSRRRGGRRCRPGPSCRACAGPCASAWSSPVRAWWRSSTLRSIGWGNLGAWPKPPWTGSKLCAGALRGRVVEQAGLAAAPSSPGELAHRAEPFGHLGGRSTISSRRSCQARCTLEQDAGKAGHPARVAGREVGAAEERLQVGREEDRHRPAAVPGHRLHGGHVDLVEVGPLLAVDLDVDEVLVHQRRRCRDSRSSRAP